jgi:hypothetical protein
VKEIQDKIIAPSEEVFHSRSEEKRIRVMRGDENPFHSGEAVKSDYCHTTKWSHQCRIAAAHPTCRCIQCGESYPNPEWRGSDKDQCLKCTPGECKEDHY